MNQEQTPEQDRDPKNMTGGLLIGIGLLLFILQFVTGPTFPVLFLLGGAAFVVVYFNRKAYGLLVPGCILIGIGIGRLGEQSSIPLHDVNLVGLGVGFLGIYVIDKLYRGQTPWWPLVPGLILVMHGGFSGHVEFGKLVSKGWPLILVILGILFLSGKLGSKRERSDGE